MFNTKSREEFWTKCRFPVFYVTILLFLVLLYVLDMTQLDMNFIKFPTMNIVPSNGFAIKTSGCRIPYLDPYDKTVLKFVKKSKPLQCSTIPPLINSNLTSIYVEHKSLPFYNINDMESLECCYQPFWRVDSKPLYSDNFYGYGDCKYFSFSIKIMDEFVKVICKVNNTKIYTDFHSFVPEKRKHEVLNRNAHKLSEMMNVLIIGLDSISRLNFERQMPLTASFLRYDLETVELIGYNKVGDNTFPNLIPILSGLSVEELTKLCWKTTNTKFDKCPFIWKNFSAKGYATSYAEDSSWMGLFNYVKTGFQSQPTDYYWRTFNYIAEKEIGHTKPYNADLCLGTRPVYSVLLDYILKFVVSLKDKPFFSFFWGTSLSHDNLNYPSMGDAKYRLFFENLQKTNILNQSVLIILSDHGMRWGDIRSTHQGHLEERLPFLFFSFPKWFKRKYSTAIANLRRNRRRLTTPYDLHETLSDLLNLSKILPGSIKERSSNKTDKRGVSLFLNIPENRVCSTAGIEQHWCTCQTSVEVKKDNSIVKKAANFIVNYINTLLNGYKACAKLTLNNITDARLLKTEDYLKNNSTIHDYTLILKTSPGDGLFEATVRCMSCNWLNPFQLTGTISRINLYGNQSTCIMDYHLKLYCYCGS